MFYGKALALVLSSLENSSRVKGTRTGNLFYLASPYNRACITVRTLSNRLIFYAGRAYDHSMTFVNDELLMTSILLFAKELSSPWVMCHFSNCIHLNVTASLPLPFLLIFRHGSKRSRFQMRFRQRLKVLLLVLQDSSCLLWPLYQWHKGLFSSH